MRAIEAESDRRVTFFPDRRRFDRVPLADKSPLPDHQRALLDACIVHEIPDQAWSDPLLLFTSPHGLSEWWEYGNQARIGWTMLESDGFHPIWSRNARNVDLLMTPSRWCEATLRRDVPGVPICRVPLAVDPLLWSTTGPMLEFEETEHRAERPAFLFAAVFATSERKHWRRLMQAFCEEFVGEDVGLFIKCNLIQEVSGMAASVRGRGVWCYVDEEPVKNEDELGIPVRVESLQERKFRSVVRDDDWMAALYRAADCVVNIGAEGFGLPIVEAALCGKPSIALDGGGARDIVTDETGYLVSCEMEPCVGHLPYVYQRWQNWPAPSIENLRAVLRTAYEDARREEKGAAARDRALHNFTPDAIAPKIRRAVECGREIHTEGKRFWAGAVAPNPLPPLTVIITTHNQLEKLQRCVASVLVNTPGACVIVADDQSEDGTQEWASAHPGVVLLEAPERGNVARNRQSALDWLYVKDDVAHFVAFLDDDIEVGPGWWEGLSTIFAACPQIGALAPLKRYPSGLVQNTGRRLKFSGTSHVLYLDRELVYPDYLESACVVERPEVWQAVRWDAEHFPFWYEDVDRSFAIREAGWDICATAAVEVIHDAHSQSNARVDEVPEKQRAFMRKWKDRM